MFEAELIQEHGKPLVCGATARTGTMALLYLLNATSNVIASLKEQGKLPSWGTIERVEKLRCGGKYNPELID